MTLPRDTTIDHLNLEVVADGRHSVPTRAFLEADGAETRALDIPDVRDQPEENGTVQVQLDFPPLTGRRFRFAIDGVREEKTIDWHSGFDIVLPVAIAELGIPGAIVSPPPEEFDTGCRDDLLTVDGRPLPVRITGSTTGALDREPLEVVLCPETATAVPLSEGSHVLRTAVGRELGIDIDWISLSSEAGGDALLDAAGRDVPAGPEVEVIDSGPTSLDVEVTGAEQPFWLVLGESHNAGWQATVVDGPGLGPPALVDGFANGWRVDPAGVGDSFTIHLEWTPQRIVSKALLVSAIAAAVCLVLAVGWKRVTGKRKTAAQGAAAPAFEPPFQAAGGQRSIRIAATAAGLGALLAALLAPPPPTAVLIVAPVLYASVRWRRARHLPAVVAAAALTVAGLYTALAEYLNRYPPDFAWPGNFETVHVLGLVAALLLLAEAFLDVLEGARSKPPATYHRGDA